MTAAEGLAPARRLRPGPGFPGTRTRGAEVTTVRVYQWDLPVDTGPLREAARNS